MKQSRSKNITFSRGLDGAFGIGMAILLMSGCAGASGAAVVGSDFKGTWIQNGAGFEKGQSIVWVDQTVVIETADGAGFAGFKEFTRDGVAQRETLNGVVGVDGQIHISDDDGFYQGRFENGAFVGTYVETGEDSTVMNVTLTRE